MRKKENKSGLIMKDADKNIPELEEIEIPELEKYPVPAMKNKARVLKAMHDLMATEKYPELHNFHMAVSNFINERFD